MNEHEEEILLSAYIDGELEAGERSRVESHLTDCRSCRRELESLRHTKRLLAAAPRRAMPPELIAQIEGRLGLPPWRPRVMPWLAPRRWVPAGAAAAALVTALWVGVRPPGTEEDIPLEALLTAHSRYAAEALVPDEGLAACDYSSRLAAGNEDSHDQEMD